MKTYRYCFKPKGVGHKVWVTRTRWVKKNRYKRDSGIGLLVKAAEKALLSLFRSK